MNRRPGGYRERQSRDRELAIRLTDRDVAVMRDVFLHGAMLRGQIQELYFRSLQRCNARLRLLFDAGYLTRASAPTSPSLAPAAGHQAIYLLGRAGVPIVARELEWDLAKVRSHLRHGTPTFLAHNLEIVEFRLAVRRAISDHSDVELRSFRPELLCGHRFSIRGPGDTWQKVALKPDGYLCAIAQNQACHFFVEIDLGHTASGPFLTKLNLYRSYLAGGLFRKRYEADAFRTLVITTSRARENNLVDLVEEEGSDLFWFTTFELVRTEGALAPIWRVPLSTDPARQLLLGSRSRLD